MKTLDSYISRTVIFSISLTFITILLLMGFFELIQELEDAGKGNYEVIDVVFYILLQLPKMAYEIFPVVVLLGSLIGLGSLANNSELTAMRAVGVSLRRIIFSVLRVGLIGIVVVVLIGEVIAPNTEQYAERMKLSAMARQVTLQTKYGFWARDKNTFINIRQILPGSQLRHIFIYEFTDDNQLQSSTYAAAAHYVDGKWLLKGVRSSELSDSGVSSTHLAKTTWESLISPKILDVVVVKPSMLPVWDLYRYISFMRQNGQESTVYEVAFWGKLMMPVTTMIMVFLSVPFVFGVLRTVGIGQRIFFGALAGLGFFMLNRIFGHMAVVYEMSPLVVTLIPVLIFLMIGVWYTRRIA